MSNNSTPINNWITLMNCQSLIRKEQEWKLSNDHFGLLLAAVYDKLPNDIIIKCNKHGQHQLRYHSSPSPPKKNWTNTEIKFQAFWLEKTSLFIFRLDHHHRQHCSYSLKVRRRKKMSRKLLTFDVFFAVCVYLDVWWLFLAHSFHTGCFVCFVLLFFTNSGQKYLFFLCKTEIFFFKV